MPHTANYHWETKDLLGVGGFGRVYKGTEKKSHKPVAIKTFSVKVDKYIQQEADILSLTNHENIVRFLGMEKRTDVRTKDKVLVMEFCDGNVNDMILENGLEYGEFISVCKQLKSALQHLRERDLIHRDIKPENILTSKVSGDLINYKLGDFGSARVLKPNQTYASLHGTVEFMHPDIFEKYHASGLNLNHPVPQNFGATHELWSIGVTLYNVATGNLPFIPRNGRDDFKKMYEMISRKKPDDISATELKSGRIVWSNKLPGFDDEITALLVGLLNSDKENMWTFEQFFREVDKLPSKKLKQTSDENSKSVRTVEVPAKPKERETTEAETVIPNKKGRAVNTRKNHGKIKYWTPARRHRR